MENKVNIFKYNFFIEILYLCTFAQLKIFFLNLFAQKRFSVLWGFVSEFLSKLLEANIH